MEPRPERGSMDDAQKAKLIFISLAIVVMVLLIFSFISGNKARAQLNTALKEVEALQTDNAKLAQWLEERTQEVERYKKAYEECKGKLKPKPRPPAKKTTTKKPAAKSTKKKTTR